jgi:hypothetical protein
VVSDVLGARLLGPARQRWVVGPSSVLSCLPLLVFAVTPGLPVALVLLVVSGLGSAYQLGLDSRLVEVTPEPLVGRVLALQGPVLMFTQGAAFAVWGALGEVLGVQWVVVAAGICGLALVGLLRAGRADPAVRTAAGSG